MTAPAKSKGNAGRRHARRTNPHGSRPAGKGGYQRDITLTGFEGNLTPRLRFVAAWTHDGASAKRIDGHDRPNAHVAQGSGSCPP